MSAVTVDTNFVLHYTSDMKNVTITMDEEVAYWVRIRAAEREMSVSRYVGEVLRQSMNTSESYREAMRRNLARKPRAIGAGGYPSREELHDRPVLRR